MDRGGLVAAMIRISLRHAYERFVRDVADRVAERLPRSDGAATYHAVDPPSSSSGDPAIDPVEWEALAQPVVVTDVRRIGDVEGHLGVATFVRGPQYQIQATIRCPSSELARSLMKDVPGTIHEGVLLQGEDERGRIVRVPKLFVSTFVDKWDASGATTEMSASVGAIHRELNEGLVTTEVDWFISGPRDRLSRMARRTERTKRRSYQRTRHGPVGGPVDAVDVQTPGPPAWSEELGSWDYFMVPAGAGRRAAVAEVPKLRGPRWSRCVAIEYRDDWGGIPNDDERIGVSEAVGFLFGRHMLKVGSTAHGDDGFVIRDSAQNPWGRDVVSTCEASDTPPIPPAGKLGEIEEVFGPLVERYLALREELDLSKAVWTIWAADRAPAGFDLPLLSSALERLMRAWFKSTRTRSRGEYMPQAAFDELLADDLSSARAKLQGNAYATRIENRLRGAYRMGVNEQFETFFDELGLAIGRGEKDALRGRNSPAHGGGGDGGPEKWVRLGWAYRVLLNRTILHLLGYTGRYIDYSVLGHPVRSITDPIGFRSG